MFGVDVSDAEHNECEECDDDEEEAVDDDDDDDVKDTCSLLIPVLDLIRRKLLNFDLLSVIN